MNSIGIIGSSALLQFDNVTILQREKVTTPYGDPSSELVHGLLQGKPVVLLYRNGVDHRIPPHLVNYRANVWAFAKLGVTQLLGLAPGTGIRSDLIPGQLVMPKQLIDYTHGRPNTFYENDFSKAKNVDLREPYALGLREIFARAAQDHKIELNDVATYGVVQGPRSETLAESSRYERDGCDYIGMTGMPEAILAREMDIEYTNLTLIMDRATAYKRVDGAASAVKKGLQTLHRLISQGILLL